MRSGLWQPIVVCAGLSWLSRSTVGRWTNGTAIALVAVDQAGAQGVGVAFATPLICGALAAPLVSVAADRFPRERVLVAVNLALTAFALAIALAVASSLPLAAVIALQSVIAIISTLEHPASRALVPSLAETPQELTAANAVASGIQSVSIVAGPAVAGALAALAGHSAMFVAGAGLFGLSALLATMLPRRGAVADAAATRLTLAELLAGIRAVAGDRALRVLVGLYAAQTFVGGALNVLIVVVGADLLLLGDSGIALLVSALGVGGILGTIAAAGLGGRARLAGVFAFGLVLWGAPLTVVGAWPFLAVTVVALAVIGVADALVDVSVVTLIQRVAPEDVLGRVFGVLESTLLGMVGTGCLLAPVVTDAFGVRSALVFFGALLPVSVALFWRALARLERPSAAPDRLALLRAQPIFAPLPQQALEALSTRLRQSVGRRRRGRDPGGRERRSLLPHRAGNGRGGNRRRDREDGGAGRGVRRDRARARHPADGEGDSRGPVRLLSLDRDVFLSAVTGHPASAAAADAVVGARLARGPVPLSSP